MRKIDLIAFVFILVNSITGIALGYTGRGSVTLSTDVSDSVITVDHSFKGAKVTLFGTAQLPFNKIVMSLEGLPVTKSLIQKRKNRFGVWLSGRVIRLNKVPKAYFLLSNFNPSQGSAFDAVFRLELGLNNFDFACDINVSPDLCYESIKMIIEEGKGRGIYQEELKKGVVNVSGTSLFKGTFALPSSIERGKYIMSTYVFSNSGQLISVSIDNLIVTQVGVGGYILQLIEECKPLYYALCVALAVSIGFFSYAFAAIIGRRQNMSR